MARPFPAHIIAQADPSKEQARLPNMVSASVSPAAAWTAKPAHALTAARSEGFAQNTSHPAAQMGPAVGRCFERAGIAYW